MLILLIGLGSPIDIYLILVLNFSKKCCMSHCSFLYLAASSKSSFTLNAGGCWRFACSQ